MNAVIIVAAGKGTRMRNADKLLMPVAGRPVVEHTWERFDRSGVVNEIVIVIREGQNFAFERIAATMAPHKPYKLVTGGKER